MGSAAYDAATSFISKRMTGHGTRTLHWYESDYWIWKDVAYEPIPKTDLRRLLMGWLQSTTNGEVDSRFRDEVWEHVDSLLYTKAPREMPTWLPLPNNPAEASHEWLLWRNGLLDITAMAQGHPPVLVPTTPRWFSGTHFATDWTTNATCPLWESTLLTWMCGDRALVRFLQEFVGYCLIPDMRHGIALFLEGEGANGKTTFADIITALVGQHNCSSVPLQDWSLTFSLADTYGKLINFSPETDARKEVPAALLKGYVTGDLYTFKRKYKPGVTARSTAKLIITWNRRPAVSDDSDGFWRRVRLVPWRAQFSSVTRDETLPMKLRKELPGIARWAVEGLVRLRQVGKFSEPEAIRDAATAYRDESDTVRAFLNVTVESDRESCLTKTVLYHTYSEWCEDRGFVPAKMEGFMRTLYRRYPSAKGGRRRIDGERLQVVEGLTLTDEGRSLVEEETANA